jgi:mannose-1-phosphate guanylyltransferase/mannose-6-phosphate isomerase
MKEAAKHNPFNERPNMTPITPILLCGGSGTRLWPLSRKTMPKQFTPLLGDETLYQSALKRLSGFGWAAPIVVTADTYLTVARDQAMAAGIAPSCLIVEPSPRNTAPAILAAALHVAEQNPAALMLIAPSDHAIPNADAFRAAVFAGTEAAMHGQIVTFGIRPTRAETGYGWLELDERPKDFNPRPIALKRFVEKPQAPEAEAMLNSGRFLWNAGIFLATAKTLIDAFRTYAHDLVLPVLASVLDGDQGPGTLHLSAKSWADCKDISVDYAVMERAANLCVVPFAAGWSDLGDWDAIWRESASDADGCVTTGNVTAISCVGSLLRSGTEGVELVGIGLTNMVVIAMDDAILVADRSRVQEVKEAVARLKSRCAVQAEGFASREAAWSETDAGGVRYGSRCQQLAPGSELFVSANQPQTRLVVLSGRAVVQNEIETIILQPGANYAWPAQTAGIIVNPGATPLVLVEMLESGAAAPKAEQRRVVTLEHCAFAAE